MSDASAFTCVLWDVDGTIIDASEGIMQRLGRALEHFGHPAPREADLPLWIGPPMYESFQVNLGMTPAQSADAVTFYRGLSADDDYTTGVHVIDGMAELIADLDAAGVPQATASSKPENQVVALMDHFDLARHLQATVGSTPDEKTRSRKADIVAESLRRLREKGVDTSRPVLVGDRHHDVDGGLEQGVPVVFVRWGFSRPEEADGARWVVADVDALRALLLPDAAATASAPTSATGAGAAR